MPEVCRFHNIRIVFNSREHHNVAHFHVVHPDFRASFDISNCRVMAGRIPTRFRRLILDWALEHQAELLAGWEDIRRGRTPSKISPPSRR